MENNSRLFTLEKMSAIHSDTVEYFFDVSETEKIRVNDFLGKSLKFKFTGTILCGNCGKKTKKSFNQGYCYPCFIKLAACDMCILKPETCHYEQGTCREPEWAKSHCLTDHVVYLANSSGLKVGITRLSQIPVRWIDQGADTAIPLFQVSNRHQSGLLEVALAKFVPDRTQWQKMLKGEVEPIDLEVEKKHLLPMIAQELKKFPVKEMNEGIRKFNYPVLQYPKKVTSFNLDKEATVEGTLQGIKGQYLIFDTGVINIRKYGGYQIEFNL